MTTTAAEPTTTEQPATAKPAPAKRQTRTRKPAGTSKSTTTKPKSTAKPKATEPKAATVNDQKRQVVERMIAVVAADLSKRDVPGVAREDALTWAAAYMSYFPGVRQGRVQWPSVLPAISMAGARKPE